MPRIPDQLRYLWEYFLELSYTRQNYGWGITPLTYNEINAWRLLRGINLDAWELDTLIRIDSVYMDVHAKVEEQRRQKNG